MASHCEAMGKSRAPWKTPVFAATGMFVLALAASPARAEGESVTGPCDAVVTPPREPTADRPQEPMQDLGGAYHRWEAALELRLRERWGLPSDATGARVTPGCRAEAPREAAPAAVAAARALTERSDSTSVERGRMALCKMQAPGVLAELGAWMADEEHPLARAVCVAELATWPGAAVARGTILAGAVRRPQGNSWEIDPAIVAAANVLGTSQVRDDLVPLLAEAHAHHALGYDRLRAGLCAEEATMSGNRARACSTLPAQAEDGWRRHGPRAWLIRGFLTVGYGAAIAASIAARDSEAGRPIATVAGVAGGWVTGAAAAYYGGVAGGVDDGKSEMNVGFEGLLIGGTIVGSVLGGLAAHALAASPGARVPVTVIGLAPLYVVSIASTFQ